MNNDHALRYHDLRRNEYIRYFRGHTSTINTLCMSPKTDMFMSAAQVGGCAVCRAFCIAVGPVFTRQLLGPGALWAVCAALVVLGTHVCVVVVLLGTHVCVAVVGVGG